MYLYFYGFSLDLKPTNFINQKKAEKGLPRKNVTILYLNTFVCICVFSHNESSLFHI